MSYLFIYYNINIVYNTVVILLYLFLILLRNIYIFFNLLFHPTAVKTWPIEMSEILLSTYTKGTAVAQWLRCCATNRKVAGSIPDGVMEFFTDIILPIALWPLG